MKLVQVLLLNIATVAVALVVYDQLRTDPLSGSRDRATRSDDRESAAVERGVLPLEARLEASSADAVVYARLEALEEFMKRYAEPPEEETSKEAAGTDRGSPEPSALPEEPTPAEVKRFRQLRDAVRREDIAKKNRARVEKALNGLPVRLTKRQRERVHTAHAAFEPRVSQIWTEVKIQARATIEAGGEVDRTEIVTATTARIQQEFAATLTDIVDHQGDAEAIAAVLMPMRGGK